MSGPRHVLVSVVLAVVLVAGAGCGREPAGSAGSGPSEASSAGDTGEAGDTDGPTPEVPADFPLVPRAWRELADGADHTLRPMRPGAAPELTACGTSVGPLPGAEVVRARLTGPEDVRSRHLLVGRDQRAAQRLLADVRRVYGDCPRERSSPPLVKTHEVRPSPLGEEAVVVAGSWGVRTGPPAPGLETVVVVRAGSAVLVEQRYDETTSSEARLRSRIAEQRAQLRQAVDAMCALDGSRC